MHDVLELRFDEQTENRLLEAWQLLVSERIVETGPEGVPHISLSSFASCDRDQLTAQIEQLAARDSFEVDFSYVGSFGDKVLFLGVTSTKALMDLHQAGHRKCLSSAKGLAELYLPDRVVFHTTLGAPVKAGALGAGLDLINSLGLPSSGRVDRVALVEYSPARVVAEKKFTDRV